MIDLVFSGIRNDSGGISTPSDSMRFRISAESKIASALLYKRQVYPEKYHICCDDSYIRIIKSGKNKSL